MIKRVEQSATNDQIAAVMLMRGDKGQVAEAVAYSRGALTERPDVDALAYLFWSVHPKEIDEWEKTAPEIPEGYKGGVRAWFYACKMREAFGC